MTAVGHGGDPSDSAPVFPRKEAEGLLMQSDLLSTRLPAGDLVGHWNPVAAVPGVRSGDGIAGLIMDVVQVWKYEPFVVCCCGQMLYGQRL